MVKELVSDDSSGNGQRRFRVYDAVCSRSQTETNKSLTDSINALFLR